MVEENNTDFPSLCVFLGIFHLLFQLHIWVCQKLFWGNALNWVEKQPKNIDRGHTELNHGPIGLQPIALPLSYTSTRDKCIKSIIKIDSSYLHALLQPLGLCVLLIAFPISFCIVIIWEIHYDLDEECKS